MIQHAACSTRRATAPHALAGWLAAEMCGPQGYPRSGPVPQYNARGVRRRKPHAPRRAATTSGPGRDLTGVRAALCRQRGWEGASMDRCSDPKGLMAQRRMLKTSSKATIAPERPSDETKNSSATVIASNTIQVKWRNQYLSACTEPSGCTA